MPISSLPKDNCLYHIYNKGIEDRLIFKENEDYEVFVSFLEEYLTSTSDSEKLKKDFTIRGKVFKGLPHLPKNYLDKIELVAYSLMPDHFHLILNQKTNGSIPNFIRSLCTRYSMYFNKKYNRSGPLYKGPYKSVLIEDENLIPSLIDYIHHDDNEYSSHLVFKGQKSHSWVKTEMVPNVSNGSIRDIESLPKGLTFEGNNLPLERIETKPNKPSKQNQQLPIQSSRFPEMSALFVAFLVLVGLGMRNIQQVSMLNLATSNPVQNQAVLADSVEQPEAKTPRTMVVVDIPNTLEYINIRTAPDGNSTKVAEAKNGESFELVSVDSGWYEVKLTDTKTGYITSKYTYLLDTYD